MPENKVAGNADSDDERGNDCQPTGCYAGSPDAMMADGNIRRLHNRGSWRLGYFKLSRCIMFWLFPSQNYGQGDDKVPH